MAELVAQSIKNPAKQWRKPFPTSRVVLGKRAEFSQWVVDWDDQISRMHAWLEWKDDCLYVQRVRIEDSDPKRSFEAKNPIYYREQDQIFERFSIVAGESFVIGETRFTLVVPPPPVLSSAEPLPASEMTLGRGDLLDVRYLDADELIEVLSVLPEVIRFIIKDEELEQRVARVLLRGIPRCNAAAVVRLNVQSGEPKVELLAAEQRSKDVLLKPSLRLVSKALRSGKNEIYRWDMQNDSSLHPTEPLAEFEWACCVPLPDDPSPNWALYVSGRLTGPQHATEGTVQADQFKPDVKFVELVADIFGSLRLVRDLRKRHDELARFLSRGVMAELARCDAQNIAALLEAREVLATVLFCDLRGFSKMVENDQQQKSLSSQWQRVREALGIMTSNISNQDGVIGDFQGDAAMGFWGWPEGVGDLQERLERQVEYAARAALSIWRDFNQRAAERDHPLAGFACGIGIATGPAFAGRLGTPDQFKVGAYGHVVNLASRMESMTKKFQSAILLDEQTTRILNDLPNKRWFRLRRVAKVMPAGMTTSVTITELIPPDGEPGAMREAHRQSYERALDAFMTGRWADANHHLDRCPPDDGAVKVLEEFMRQNTRPTNWDGVIAIPK